MRSRLGIVLLFLCLSPRAVAAPKLYLGLGHTEPVSAIAWSPDGKTLASGSSDETIVLWDVAARRPRATLTGYTGSAIGSFWRLSIVWSPDGKTVAGWDGLSAILWNAATGQPRFRLTGFVRPLGDLCWSRDGRTLIGFDFRMVKDRIPQIGQSLPQLRDNVVLWDAATGRRRARLTITAGSVGEGRPLSPDGKTLATFQSQPDNRMALWDTTTWRRRSNVNARVERRATLGWNPSSRILATLTGTDVVLWDAGTGRRRAALSPGDNETYFTSLAWSPDGKSLATVCSRTDLYGSRVILWDPVTGQRRTHLDGNVETEHLSWSPNGKTLVGYGNAGVVLWDLSSRSRSVTLPDASWPAAWSPNGKVLATGAPGNGVALWEGHTGRRLGALTSHAAALAGLSWSPDGKAIAVGSGGSPPHPPSPDDATAHATLWDVRSARVRDTLAGLPGAVFDLAWSRDGAAIAVAAGRYGIIPLIDGAMGWLRSAVVVWRPGLSKRRVDLAGASFPVTWTPDGQMLVTGSSRGDALLWDVRTAQRQGTLPVGYTWSLAMSPDGKSLATKGYSNGQVAYYIWDVATQKVRAELSVPGSRVSSLAWSPNGVTLAISADDQFVTLCDTRSGSARHTLTTRLDSSPRPYGWPGAVAATLAWRPDGKVLATGVPDAGIVKLWQADSGQLITTLNNPSLGASPLTWSPDGRILACACQNHTIVLWDPASRKRRAVLRGHTSAITALAWSPDGRTVATTSADGSLRLWSAATGKELVAFYSLDGGKKWVATTPDCYCQASPHAVDLIQWRQGATLWPMAQFRRRFAQPHLVRKALSR